MEYKNIFYILRLNLTKRVLYLILYAEGGRNCVLKAYFRWNRCYCHRLHMPFYSSVTSILCWPHSLQALSSFYTCHREKHSHTGLQPLMQKYTKAFGLENRKLSILSLAFTRENTQIKEVVKFFSYKNNELKVKCQDGTINSLIIFVVNITDKIRIQIDNLYRRPLRHCTLHMPAHTWISCTQGFCRTPPVWPTHCTTNPCPDSYRLINNGLLCFRLDFEFFMML